ncbi:hypothetical protein HPP92_005627 [Vanilla planifolia]|uniref:Uncharacterized protein n=1 Tax=Vanilla planifolia TaxID=51239 RepID=A0A835RIX9_VANPL|nr:hypothetical protein HPP92_005627 [Vanilla planifolia]
MLCLIDNFNAYIWFLVQKLERDFHNRCQQHLTLKKGVVHSLDESLTKYKMLCMSNNVSIHKPRLFLVQQRIDLPGGYDNNLLKLASERKPKRSTFN